ncbi:hypothetical protein K458DRAFT_402481 [Lentithecium fluviatile CBS 122367]|uniref:Uncharacterized protein n=1 Tax=Lentithecium fluviatile CBS 122367 TaxID=1168545 RepID=A0A6G1J9Q6_9PLEO|nr:hypothetical protein K458DRAFT_402481 [Lentithecium fluviatile CBS 122367]
MAGQRAAQEKEVGSMKRSADDTSDTPPKRLRLMQNKIKTTEMNLRITLAANRRRILELEGAQTILNGEVKTQEKIVRRKKAQISRDKSNLVTLHNEKRKLRDEVVRVQMNLRYQTIDRFFSLKVCAFHMEKSKLEEKVAEMEKRLENKDAQARIDKSKIATLQEENKELTEKLN